MSTVSFLAGVLSLAFAARPDPQCRDPMATSLGPDRSDTEVAVFLDPLASSAPRTYAELRQLTLEAPGQVRIDIYFAPPSGTEDPVEHAIRVWATAMAMHGWTEPALKAIGREGHRRLYARLGSRARRDDLARGLGFDPVVHEADWNSGCATTRLDHAKTSADTFAGRRSNTNLFVLDDLTFDDGPQLELLRAALGRIATRRRRTLIAGPPAVVDTRTVSPRLRRPELRGAILGGLGLPHRLLVVVSDEDDLHATLAPALEMRRRLIGRLSIQVVARGPSLSATTLRHRLCAARESDRIVPYLTVFSADLATRRVDGPTSTLLNALDSIPQERCASEPDPADLGLPEGLWIDGIPKTRAELDGLIELLDALDASTRPLSVWLPPATETL